MTSIRAVLRLALRSLTRLPTHLLPAVAAVLLPLAGGAQRTLSVRADNDAFNFWQAPWNRPDEEYTSGVRVTMDLAGRAPWARRRRSAKDDCGGAAKACAGHSYAFGQDIYTAVRSRDQPTPLPGARPDAGVLWFAASDWRSNADKESELRWTVGFTGRQALAAPMQRFFHNVAPGWNRPIDWTKQLPTEPVFAVSYDQRLLRTAGAVELQPHVGASLGNLLTEARVGLGARLGRDLHLPRWMAAGNRPVTWALLSDATLRGVARNETLSGTIFRPSEHVTLRPLVTDLQLGTTVRWRELGLSWTAHQTGAEYVARHSPHAWSTLEVAWMMGR